MHERGLEAILDFKKGSGNERIKHSAKVPYFFIKYRFGNVQLIIQKIIQKIKKILTPKRERVKHNSYQIYHIFILIE